MVKLLSGINKRNSIKANEIQFYNWRFFMFFSSTVTAQKAKLILEEHQISIDADI